MAGTLIKPKPPDEVWIFKDAEDEWACVQTSKPSDLYTSCRYVPAVRLEAAERENTEAALHAVKLRKRAEIAEQRVGEWQDRHNMCTSTGSCRLIGIAAAPKNYVEIRKRSADLDMAAGIKTPLTWFTRLLTKSKEKK